MIRKDQKIVGLKKKNLTMLIKNQKLHEENGKLSTKLNRSLSKTGAFNIIKNNMLPSIQTLSIDNKIYSQELMQLKLKHLDCMERNKGTANRRINTSI